jgi:hypothetical protein
MRGLIGLAKGECVAAQKTSLWKED